MKTTIIAKILNNTPIDLTNAIDITKRNANNIIRPITDTIAPIIPTKVLNFNNFIILYF